MKRHPTFCGILLYGYRSMFQETGVDFAGDWGIVQLTGHLYNALRQEKLLDREWKDMEMLLRYQKKIFVGDPPTTPEDYLKNFCLRLGCSVSTFAKDRRKNQLPKPSKRLSLGLVELAPVSRMFKDRYRTITPKHFTLQALAKILSQSNWVDDSKEDGTELFFALRRENIPYTMKRRWEGNNNPKNDQPVSATYVLQTIRNCLQAEFHEFNINYFKLHIVCWEVLRQVKAECDEMLLEAFQRRMTPGYPEQESQLRMVVGNIFIAAFHKSGRRDAMSPDDNNSAPDFRRLILEKAANSFAGMLEVGFGSWVCDTISSQQRVKYLSEEDDVNSDTEVPTVQVE